MDDSNDDSGNSDKTGVFKVEHTRVVEKTIQVQMPSGKIYGPYSRFEVLTFIEKKKIRGEEKILLEGETGWRAIASDTEFFDAIHQVLAGKKLNLKKKSKTESVFSDTNDNTKVSNVGTRTEYLDKSEKTAVVEHTRITSPLDEEKNPEPYKTTYPENNNVMAPPKSQAKPTREKKTKAKPKKSGLPRLLLFVVTAGVLVVAFLPDKSKKKPGSSSEGGESALYSAAAPNYTRALLTQLRGLHIEKVNIPANVTRSATLVGVPGFTLNGLKLISKVKLAVKNQATDLTQKASFWIQLSSDLQLLGVRVQVLSFKEGSRIGNVGKYIQEQLSKKNLISAEEKILIEAFIAHSTGDWEKVETLSRQLSRPIMTWLLEDSIWWSSWAEGKNNPLPNVASLRRDPELDISSKVRQNYRGKSGEILGWLQQLAKTEATSPLLWHSSAELSWRSSKNVQVQSTYRDFTIGLASLALYPPSIQLIYWTEFSRFLQSYARAETHSRALKNIDLLGAGNLVNAKPGTWWDIDSEGLLAREIADDILEKSKKEILSDRDRAALLVLGNSLSNGGIYLFEVGKYLLLAEKWKEAETLFRQMKLLNPRDEGAYFGLVWSLAKQFKFAEAQDTFDLMLSQIGNSKNYLRIQGMLHFLARDYAEAHSLLAEAIQRNPNDAWAHFFKAQAYEVNKNYYECIKSGNLAKLHAKGEFVLFVASVLARCQVYGNIGTQKTLKGFVEVVRKNPENISLRVLLVELLQFAGLPHEALKWMNEGLVKFPYSKDIHIAAGDLLFERGRYKQSLEYFTAAARLDSESADGWVRIAQVMEKEDKYLSAAQNYVTASRTQPDYPEIYLFAARAFDKAKKVDQAAKYYALEIEYRPEGITPFIEAAEFLLRNNAPQKIPELYRNFKGGYENDPRALIRLAQAYQIMGEVNTAKGYASRAVAQAPNDPHMNYKLAVILDAAGEYGLAKSYYLKYLKLSPAARDAGSLRSKLASPPYSN